MENNITNEDNMAIPQIIDFSNQKFRCHALGKIMTNPREKSLKEKRDEVLAKIEEVKFKMSETPENKRETKTYFNLEEKLMSLSSSLVDFDGWEDEIHISDTCKSYLIQIYIFEKTGRRKIIDNKFLSKGIIGEDKGISLISRVENDFLTKNKIRISNEFIEGECDIWKKTKYIRDVKSSWDLQTFQVKTEEKINNDYFLQGQGYMELFDENEYIVSYVLINTPDDIIEQECKSLLYKIGTSQKDTEYYRQSCEEIKFNMTFDDIPERERIINIPFKKDSSVIESIYERIKLCRNWLNQYAKSEHERVYGKIEINQKENAVPNILAVNTPIPVPNDSTEFVEQKEAQGEIFESEKTENNMGEKTRFEELNVQTEDTTISSSGEQASASTEKNASKVVNSKTEVKKEIDACKTEMECIELYKKIKPLFADFPFLKDLITAKKKSITDEAAKQEELEKSAEDLKKKSKQQPAPTEQKPIEQVQSVKLTQEELLDWKKKTDECKTAKSVKELYGANKELVNSNPELRDYMIKIGSERTEKPLAL